MSGSPTLGRCPAAKAAKPAFGDAGSPLFGATQVRRSGKHRTSSCSRTRQVHGPETSQDAREVTGLVPDGHEVLG